MYRLLIGLSAFAVLSITGFVVFLYFGGSIPSNQLLSESSNISSEQTLTPGCRAKQQEATLEELPIEQQIQPILTQLNSYGLDLSIFEPINSRESLDNLTRHISSNEEQEIHSLENQYSTLNNQLLQIQQKYTC